MSTTQLRRTAAWRTSLPLVSRRTAVPARTVVGGPASGEAPSAPPVDRRVKALRRFAMSITALTVAGHLFLGFEPSLLQLAVTVVCCYGFELLLEAVDAWSQDRRPRFLGGPRATVELLLPAHIAAFSLSLLIYPGESLWVCVLAAAIAIGSKYVLRAPVAGRRRHFMNPSNLAIAIVLTFYSWVGPAPSYMFTEYLGTVGDVVLPLALLGFGLMLNVKLTRRGPLIAAWAAGFAAQAVVKGLLWPEWFSIASGLAVMTGATFVLFTNYMITDPGSTPVDRRGQIMFGLGCAAIYGVLSAVGITYGLFYCVVLGCLVRGGWLWAVHLHRTSGERRAAARATTTPTVTEERA